MKATAVVYASFWKRLQAWFTDAIAFIALWLLLHAVIDYLITGDFRKHLDATHAQKMEFLTIKTIYNVMFLIWIWLYSAIAESSPMQATFGKRTAGLRVTDLNGNRISFGRASLRHFAKIISIMTGFLGYVVAALTAKRQALHDIIAGTLVLAKQNVVSANIAQNAFQS